MTPAHTIAAHLQRRNGSTPAPATIWKILKRRGLIITEPRKRPRSSYLRFEADLLNETWQSDVTHWAFTAEPELRSSPSSTTTPDSPSP